MCKECKMNVCKRALVVFLSFVMMLGHSTHVLAATDVPAEEMGTVEEVKDGVYEFRDAEGELIMVFEEDDSIAMPRGSWTIDWTIGANSKTKGTNQFNVSKGTIFRVDITFSKTGKSQIGLYDVNNSKYIWWPDAETTKFKGTITIESGYGLVSFALKNASSSKITYTGSYSI